MVKGKNFSSFLYMLAFLSPEIFTNQLFVLVCSCVYGWFIKTIIL